MTLPKLLAGKELEAAITEIGIDASVLEALSQRISSKVAIDSSVNNPLYRGEHLVDYFVRIKRLDKILGELTRDYCATKCYKTPKEIGCCANDICAPKFIGELQPIDAEGKEGYPKKKVPLDSDEHVASCNYHTPKGCALTISKPPVCLGYFCHNIADELRSSYFAKGEEFIGKIVYAIQSVTAPIFPGDQELRKNLDLLDKAIELGTELVTIKYAKQSRAQQAGKQLTA